MKKWYLFFLCNGFLSFTLLKLLFFFTCITDALDAHILCRHTPLSSQTVSKCDALLTTFWPLICRNKNHNVFILNIKRLLIGLYNFPLRPVPLTAGFHRPQTYTFLPPSTATKAVHLLIDQKSLCEFKKRARLSKKHGQLYH